MLGRNIRDRLSMMHENPKDESKPPVKHRFRAGDTVAIRTYDNRHEKWKTGVVERVFGPRNVMVRSGSTVHKRHIDQTRKIGKVVKQTDPSILVALDLHKSTSAETKLVDDVSSEINVPTVESNSKQVRLTEDQLQDISSLDENQNQAVTVRRSERVNKGVPPKRFVFF